MTHARTHTHTHSLSLFLSLSPSLARSLDLSLSLFLSLYSSLTHTKHSHGQGKHTLPGIPVDCSGLQDNNTNALQIDFDNKLTLHVYSGGYCHDRSGTKAKECKWGFGGKSETQQHEGLKGLYGSKTCSTEFHLERDCRNRLHPCMSRNHPRRLCVTIHQWRLMGCNMDHQPFLCLDDPL